jgi:predicted nucleic-acid-binding Zn-ribbon protein
MPKKKIKRMSIVRKLDKIVSLIIRARDKRCVVCGNKEYLQNGHLFPRKSYSTRWDVTPNGNCHTQCRGCNLSHNRDFYPYSNWYVRKFGQKSYDKLHVRYKTKKRFTDKQLEALYDKFKEVRKGRRQ